MLGTWWYTDIASHLSSTASQRLLIDSKPSQSINTSAARAILSGVNE
ncbi:MAG TPA: hypothetical protein PKE58_04980 [Acidobacteriota bacterium]|nr:hypothetical protein [Acidobacteriota bacterium]